MLLQSNPWDFLEFKYLSLPLSLCAEGLEHWGFRSKHKFIVCWCTVAWRSIAWLVCLTLNFTLWFFLYQLKEMSMPKVRFPWLGFKGWCGEYVFNQPPVQTLKKGKKNPQLWSFILSTCLAAGNENRLARWRPEGREDQSGHVSACHVLVGPASVSAVIVPTKQWQAMTEVWENKGKEQKENAELCCGGMILSNKLYEMCISL